jgi:hypothetical protein
MIYEYRNPKTGETLEKEFSMSDSIPSIIEENNKEYTRVFGNTSFHIPYGWGDTKNRPKYNKSPSRKKHFW